jgi:hypothetical protein
MIYWTDIILEVLQTLVLCGIVWKIRTVKPVYTGPIQASNPNGYFKKAKRKPIALDDEAAYELEQKAKRGPQP